MPVRCETQVPFVLHRVEEVGRMCRHRAQALFALGVSVELPQEMIRCDVSELLRRVDRELDVVGVLLAPLLVRAHLARRSRVIAVAAMNETCHACVSHVITSTRTSDCETSQSKSIGWFASMMPCATSASRTKTSSSPPVT